MNELGPLLFTGRGARADSAKPAIIDPVGSVDFIGVRRDNGRTLGAASADQLRAFGGRLSRPSLPGSALPYGCALPAGRAAATVVRS